MRRVRLLPASVLAGVSLFVSACGGGGDSTTAPPQPPAVSSVIVTLGTSQLVAGATTAASVELRSASGSALSGRAISWTSSSPTVAVVDQSGVVTAVTPGTTTISATSEGRTGSAVLTVTPAPVATVIVNVAQPTIVVGSTTTATALLRDDRGNVLTGRGITFTSSAPSVASVDAIGIISAIVPGNTVITATSEGKSGTAVVTVQPPPVATVSVTLAQSTLSPGASTTASATLRDTQGAVLTGRAVTWTSSAPNVATVNAAGLVTAVATGTSTISATSEGRIGSVVLTVQLPPVTSVTMSGSTRVKVGDAYTYTVTAKLADGTVVNRPLTWSTSDATRASITQAGVLTPLLEGSFRIQVTIDGALWDVSATAYDWQSFSSAGSLFASIDADNQITNQFGTTEYPQLVMSCGTSGFFFVWVRVPSFVTSSGLVAISFDGATPVSQMWDELSPNFNTLWKPGSNGAIKTFAQQLAASRLFGFAFTEYRGSAKAMIFRVSGLSSRLAPIVAACPSNAIVANAAQLAGMADAVATDSQNENSLREVRRARATELPAALVGPTISALDALKVQGVQLMLRKR